MVPVMDGTSATPCGSHPEQARGPRAPPISVLDFVLLVEGPGNAGVHTARPQETRDTMHPVRSICAHHRCSRRKQQNGISADCACRGDAAAPAPGRCGEMQDTHLRLAVRLGLGHCGRAAREGGSHVV